jgi:hypothetical protein
MFSPELPEDSGVHSHIFNGYRCYFPEISRPGRQINHSPATSAEAAFLLPLNAFMTRRGRIVPLPSDVMKTLTVGFYSRSFARAAGCARNNVFSCYSNKVTILVFSQCDYSCLYKLFAGVLFSSNMRRIP